MLISYILSLGGHAFDLSEPIVTGILNVTPDSFHVGSRKQTAEATTECIREIIQEGGRIIDIGTCSTRPGGGEPVDGEGKLRRLRHALEIIRVKAPDLPISVDTYRADVAKTCIEEYGVEIINDISGGQADAQMYSTVGKLGVAYILMRLEHNVEGVYQVVDYKPSIEVCAADYFRKHLEQLHICGVKDTTLDPGYGLSKNMDDHYRLLTHQRGALQEFTEPVLIGFPRKRMIQTIIGADAMHSDDATSVLRTYALVEGIAQIIHTHDVRLAVEAIQAIGMIRKHLPDATGASSYTHWQGLLEIY